MTACLTLAFSAGAQTVASKVLDGGGTGPFKSIVVTDEQMPDFTIYRPEKLHASAGYDGKLPVIIFANGGCMNLSAQHERFLSEIASYGYVFVAMGPMFQGQPSREDIANVPSYKMFQALDWICDQSSDPKSEYNGVLDTGHIAAMGQSCGGAMAMYLSSDPRIKTVVMLNSGLNDFTMANANQNNVLAFTKPIIYINGGEEDVAFANGAADFAKIKDAPVVECNLPVGHGGTYAQEYGGDFAVMARTWLDYVFKGHNEGERLFRYNDNKGFEKWTIRSKNFTDANSPRATHDKTMADYVALRPDPSAWANPTGKYKVVMEVDETCPECTIYRPADLSKFSAKNALPVIVMSGPGCDYDGDSYRPFWTEVASHGYIVVACGLPQMEGMRAAMGYNNAADFQNALDWIQAEAVRPGSKYYQKMDANNVALMGQSCGGFIASNFMNDPHVKTIMFWNSGFMSGGNARGGGMPGGNGRNAAAAPEQPKPVFPMSFVTAEGDMAAAMAKSSFEATTDVPAFFASCDIPGDAHGGTFREKNGGPYGSYAVKWLDWQLKGNSSAAKYFTGSNPQIKKDKRWLDYKKTNIK